MSFTSRHLAPVLAVLAFATTFAHSAGADPDIDSESAAAVIQELQEQGVFPDLHERIIKCICIVQRMEAIIGFISLDWNLEIIRAGVKMDTLISKSRT